MATPLDFKLLSDPDFDPETRDKILRKAKTKFGPMTMPDRVGVYVAPDGGIDLTPEGIDKTLVDTTSEGGLGGMARTVGREIGWNVLPAAAAVLGGGVGTAAGALSPVKVVAPVAGLAGGLVGGIGATLAQDAAARKYAESDLPGSATVADLVRTREMGRRVNPWSARVGNLVTGFGFAKPVLTKAAMAKLLSSQTGKEVTEVTGKQMAAELGKQAAIGAGVGGAADAVMRGKADEDLAWSIASGALGGATQVAPVGLGKPVGRLAERIVGGVTGKPPEALPRQVSKELPAEQQPNIPSPQDISTDTLRTLSALPLDADMMAVSKALQRDRPDMLPLSGDATDVDLWRRKATELLGQRVRTDPAERARLAGEAYEHIAAGGDVKQLPQPFQREVAGMAAKYGGALTKEDWQAMASRQRPEDYLAERLPQLTKQKKKVNEKLAASEAAKSDIAGQENLSTFATALLENQRALDEAALVSQRKADAEAETRLTQREIERKLAEAEAVRRKQFAKQGGEKLASELFKDIESRELAKAQNTDAELMAARAATANEELAAIEQEIQQKLQRASELRRQLGSKKAIADVTEELGKLQQEQEAIPPDATKAPFDTGAIPPAEGGLVPPQLVRTEEGTLQSYGSVPEGAQVESGLPMANPMAAGVGIPAAPSKPKVVRAGGAKSGTPTPEGPEIIGKQLELTADPTTTKAATLVTPGDVIPKVPKGMKAIPTEQGLLISNPKKADPVAVAEAMTTAQQTDWTPSLENPYKTQIQIGAKHGNNSAADVAGIKEFINPASRKTTKTADEIESVKYQLVDKILEHRMYQGYVKNPNSYQRWTDAYQLAHSVLKDAVSGRAAQQKAKEWWQTSKPITAEQSGLAPAKPLGLGAEVAESPVAVTTSVDNVPGVLSELVTPETLSTAVQAHQAATGGKGVTKVVPAEQVVAERQAPSALEQADAALQQADAEFWARKAKLYKDTEATGAALSRAFDRARANPKDPDALAAVEAAWKLHAAAEEAAGKAEVRELNDKADAAYNAWFKLLPPEKQKELTRSPRITPVQPTAPPPQLVPAAPPMLGKPVAKAKKVKVVAPKKQKAPVEPPMQKTLQQLEAEYQQQHDALSKQLEQAEERLWLVESNQPELAGPERAKVEALHTQLIQLEAQGQKMLEAALWKAQTSEPPAIPPTREPANSGVPAGLVRSAVKAGFELIDRTLVKPTLGRFKAAMDKIVDLEPDGRGRELQAADLERERWVTQVQNQDRQSYNNVFSGLTGDEYKRVRQYMEDNYYDGVSLVRPTEKEQNAINVIRGTLLAQAHRMRQMGAHLVEGNRYIAENPDYIPGTPKASVRETLSVVSPKHADPVKRTEYQRLLDEWTQHYMARSGGSFQEAQAAFDKWRGQFSGRSLLNGTEYAAVRNAERYGIPRAWQEDLRVALDRHAVRSALDLGWWKYIQNNPNLAKWLGIPDNGAGVTYTPEPGEPLGYNPTVERWLQAQTAYRTQNPHPLLTLSGLAGSMMLGPASAAKDLMATPFISASLVAPDVAIAATAKTALKAFGDSARRAGSASAHNAAMAEKLTDQTVDTMATRIRDFASRLQGRTLADTIGREWAFQFGGAVNDIMMGRPGYTDWLKRMELGQGWETADNATRRTLVGDKFVDLVQSKYNAHTLPEQLLPTKDNDLSLLFWSLSRWGISRMNSFEKHVWRPAVNGDFGPLLSAMGAGALGVVAEEKLRELFNQRFGNAWLPSELHTAEDKEPLYTLLAYLNSNNITGALGMLPFMLYQIKAGEKPSTGPVNLAMTFGDSVRQRFSQMFNAMENEGANKPQAIIDTMKAIAEDNMQFVRLLNRMNQEKNWSREESIWKRQTGRAQVGGSPARRDTISPVAQFTQSQTPEEAQQLYPALETALQQPKVGKPVVPSAMRGEIGPREMGEQPGFYEWARRNGLPANEIMQQDAAKEAFNASVLRPMIDKAWEANRAIRERAIRQGQMQVAPQ